MVLGDFNANPLSDSDDTKYIRLLALDNSLCIIPYEATYHIHNCVTALDLCIADIRTVDTMYRLANL